MQFVMSLLRLASQLDTWLYDRFGARYGVLLSAGLTVEIVRHAREVIEHAGAGLAAHVLPMALDIALLLHTAGELHERLERRAGRRSAAAPQVAKE
jgi:hypothetical protein